MKSQGVILLAFATSTWAAQSVMHFFGPTPLLECRADPIISPGGPSGHVHVIQGGSNFALTMTNTTLEDSSCTSSMVKNDKSNYWTPYLYFQDPENPEVIESVDVYYMNVYYDYPLANATAFPLGLRMVVGNPELRSPPASGGRLILDQASPYGPIQPVQWICPRSAGNLAEPLYPADSDGISGVGIGDPTNSGAGVGFSDQNCDGEYSPLRADIYFPSCYDPTKRVDDYKNNMQYVTNGVCPEGFITVPQLHYEVYWNTPAFASRWTQGQGKQPFVLANGDPTGYSLHADFISGWDIPTLQQVIDNCDVKDGGVDSCPGLIGGNNVAAGIAACAITCPIEEQITGNMTKLPGNNPIGSWGVAPTAGTGGTSTIVPTSIATSIATSAQTASPTSPAESPTVIQSSGPATYIASSVPTIISTGIQSSGVATSEVATYVAQTKTADSATTETLSTASEITSIAKTTIGGVGLVTSYVSTTSFVYTTVTEYGAAPSSTSSSSGSASTIDGWSYVGCQSDSVSKRVLSGKELPDIGKVSNTNCISYCNSEGFSIAGTEYGGQCYCGNSLDASSTVLAESKCDMACEGDATETCGGGNALTVYSHNANTTSTSNTRRFLGRQVSRILGRAAAKDIEAL